MINCDKELILETFDDSDWAGSKQHRRYTSAAQHLLNGDLVHGSSRTQKVIALSSAEAELHSLVSAAADGIYIAGCLSFLTGLLVKHYILLNNMAAKTLANKRGVGRIRHLSGKLLWIQERTAKGELTVTQVSTDLNVEDLATKPLTASRMRTLLFLSGIVDSERFEPIGEIDFEEMQAKRMSSQKAKKLAKVIMRLMVLGEITGAEGSPPFPGEAQPFCDAGDSPNFTEELYSTSWSSWPQSGLALAFVLTISAVILFLVFWMNKVGRQVKELTEKMEHLNTTVVPRLVQSDVDDCIESRDGLQDLRGHVDRMQATNGEAFRTMSEGITKTHNLASQLWLGLVRLGGYVGETGEPLSEEELRSLTFQNRENADDDDDVRMRDGGSRRSRSTSCHDTPPRRGSPESAEEEIPVFDSPTEYGPPADVPEPEPHTVLSEEDADRMEKLVKELREREERAQLVGDEDEAANLRVQIANVENLQMALPRPSNAG